MDNEYPGLEKRQFKRARVSLTVVYRANEPLSLRMLTSEKDIQATMVNLSEGGMAILADYSMPVSTVLLIRFTLFRINKEDVSFYGPVSITGEVRYNTMVDKDLYRIGICFTKIEEKDRCEIADFVKTVSNISKTDNKGH
jgi:c-di-GMP-binding flagellar brake protein YcgR